MIDTPLYAAALDLVEKQGFSVIPCAGTRRRCWPGRNSRRAVPRMANWKEWFLRRWPEANIGIVTGTLSGLVVVDADGDAGLAWMREHLPVTGVYVRTGKGWHGYFRASGGQRAEQGTHRRRKWISVPTAVMWLPRLPSMPPAHSTNGSSPPVWTGGMRWRSIN